MTKTKKITAAAVIIAIMLLFGFTPIGYIPLPFTKITLMCIPVIIGVMILGLKFGFLFSGIFILTSIYTFLTNPAPTSLIMFDYMPVMFILCLIIPRVFIPITTNAVYKATVNKKPKLSYVLTAITGTLTNALIFISIEQIFFAPALAKGLGLDMTGVTLALWGVMLTNALPETIAAVIVCLAVMTAINRKKKPLIQ